MQVQFALREMALIDGVLRLVPATGFTRQWWRNWLPTVGPNRGNVYYWCHDGGGWEGEAEEHRSRGQAIPDAVKYKCLEQVAPSFTAFVLALQPEED